jgi:hypothetical protein
VAADETRRLLTSLRGWHCDGQPVDLEVAVDPERVTTAVLRHSGWRVELGHVTRFGRESLLAVRDVGQPVALRDAGRYAPFWWLAVVSGPERAVVLGATLRLFPEGGWGPGGSVPDGPPALGSTAHVRPTAPLGVAPA